MDFVFIWRLQRNIYHVVFFVTLPCVSHRAFIEIFVLTRIASQRYKKKTGHCSFREKKNAYNVFFSSLHNKIAPNRRFFAYCIVQFF